MAIEKWDVDATHSSINFSVRHLVIAKVHGKFTQWTAALELDPEQITASKVSVQIAAASIDTNEPQRDGHLKSPDFLEVDKFPTLDFKSTKVEKVGGSDYKIHGAITIRGVTKDVVLDAEFGGRAKDPWGGDRVGFTAKTKLERKEFGLKWNQALETGGVLVGETIDVTIEVEAKKA